MNYVRFFLAAFILLTSCTTGEKDIVTSDPAISRAVADRAPALFELLSSNHTGIDFVNTIVQTSEHNVLYYDYMFNGGGVAIGDINNDGLPDIYLTGNQVKNKLYLNKGDLHFEDITKKAKVEGIQGNGKSSWSSGMTMADINNDGYLDIYVCCSGPFDADDVKRNLMYINNGDLTFTEKGASYGIDDHAYSTQASFFDYDNDGDLDLYVLNHPVYFTEFTISQIMKKIKDRAFVAGLSDNMYRNNGDGTFTKVTEEAGIMRYGYGLGIMTSDIDHDGFTDVYISNDFFTPDYMFINNGDGTFTDKIKHATNHISYYGMGCDIADINNDGLVDINVVDMTATDHFRSKTLMPSMNPDVFAGLHDRYGFQYQYMFNSLQLNNGNGTFCEIAQMAGIHKSDWSWATLFADFDNDGYKDILITNGFKQDTKDNDYLMELESRLDALSVNKLPENDGVG